MAVLAARPTANKTGVSGNPSAAQRDTNSQQPRWRKKEERQKAKKKRSFPKQVRE